ncbi:DUF3150 domain-containing protein [Marinomonas algarum]|uniref:DUF3150 domain-containing protein n=1 Tax=Marinomonas algarum TaxID=2883105 RepID=A0A9X1RU52_9GAMM|nr:DUF3150 domain-containing protein [Marinomonas algarum]MCB5162951.1 DUF3150 domain-containing protein [Marinomonas algarum]
MSNITHLERLCVFHLDFDIWSGQTRLFASDLKLGEGGEIPSEKVTQLGSKRICDPQRLKDFNRLKSEARRLLTSHGMPFMNGFAVPAQKVQEICDELDRIERDFKDAKDAFISGYSAAIEEWINDNPEYEDAIRAGALPQSEVERKIGFEYEIFMIQPVEGEKEKSLSRKAEGLGGDLLDEVTQQAQDFFIKNLSGKDRCGVTTKLSLKKIRDKVDGLSFLNGNLVPLVDLLDQTLNVYEGNAIGRSIMAPHFYQVLASVLIMGDRKKIEDYANGAVTVESMADSVTPSDKSSEITEVAETETDDVSDIEDDIDRFFSQTPEGGSDSSEDDSELYVKDKPSLEKEVVIPDFDDDDESAFF